MEGAFMNMNNILRCIVWQCLREVRQANWSGDGIGQSGVTCKTCWQVLHMMCPRSGVSGYSGWGKRQWRSLRECVSVGHVTGRLPSTCKSCSNTFHDFNREVREKSLASMLVFLLGKLVANGNELSEWKPPRTPQGLHWLMFRWGDLTVRRKLV